MTRALWPREVGLRVFCRVSWLVRGSAWTCERAARLSADWTDSECLASVFGFSHACKHAGYWQQVCMQKKNMTTNAPILLSLLYLAVREPPAPS